MEVTISNGFGIKRWELQKLVEINGTGKIFEKLAPDLFTKTYPTIPHFAHSKLVTQSL